MDFQDRRLVIVLFSVSIVIWIAGGFYVPFLVHCWTQIANLAAEKEQFLADTLLIYFFLFTLIGIAVGLILSNYWNRITAWFAGFFGMIFNAILNTSKKNKH